MASRGSEEGKVESELKKGAMFKAFGILEIHCLSHDVHVEPHHFSATLSCAMAAPAVTELNGILATVPITGEYNLQVHMAGFRLDFIGFSHEVKGFFSNSFIYRFCLQCYGKCQFGCHSLGNLLAYLRSSRLGLS